VLRSIVGETARIKGESKPVAGQSYQALSVEKLLSPTYRSLTGVSLNYDGKLRTADGLTLEASGTPARALPKLKSGLGYDDKLTAEGYVFTNSSELPVKIKLTRLGLKTKAEVKLRDETLPGGSEIELSYVTSSDDPSVIFRHDGKWGWTKLAKLGFDITPSGTTGLTGHFGN